MPKDIGYFHSEKEPPTFENNEWLEEHGLSKREASTVTAYIYEDIAVVVHDAAVNEKKTDPEADVTEQLATKKTLMTVSKALITIFAELPEGTEKVLFFVDEREDGILEEAEHLWRDREKFNSPAIPITPSAKLL